MSNKILILLIAFFSLGSLANAQSFDHWETIIYNDDEWQYAVGSNDIPSEWINPSFDASLWATGTGGFGYGDGDDNTVLQNIRSVFIRKEFQVADLSQLTKLILHADYDDGFIAYLNGVEVARKNMGESGQSVRYDDFADNFIEPQLASGLLPIGIGINTSLLVEGTNLLAIQVHNATFDSSDLSSNFFLSVGINSEATIYRSTLEWFDRSVFASKLPILKVTTPDNQEIMDEPRATAHLGVINNGVDLRNTPFDTFNEYDGQIAIELRGTSSIYFDKKGYGFETRLSDGSNNNITLLGMPEENDWILHGPYSDKSLLRNVLTYHLGNETGRYAPRTRLCELFINDEYEGVYVLTEKIKQDKNRVDIAKITAEDNAGDELTGGYIIKVDRNEQNLPGVGWESNFPDYKLMAFVEPKADDITDTQVDYIKRYFYDFELAMAQEDYQETYQNFIDAASFVDYFLVTEIGKHIDAFKLSFYIYKDKNSKGGKLNFGPLWDFNLGYGNFNFNCSPDPQGWAYEFPDCGSWHPFWARKLVDIPNMQHLTKCRWEDLRAGPFRTDRLNAFLSQQVADMGKAVDRNFERWSILGQEVWPNDFVGQSYEDEFRFLSTWLEDRLAWMDANLPGDCNEYVSTDTELQEAELLVFPNPSSNSFSITWPLNRGMKNGRLEIYDVNNRLVFHQEIKSDSGAVVNTTELSVGLYNLVARPTDDTAVSYTSRLVVAR